MGKISRAERNRRIVELYSKGYSYRQIQKRYRVSSKTICKLVKGIEIKCLMCGMPKGRKRFHAHHPNRRLLPDYTAPLCPSCHGKVTVEEKKAKTTGKNARLDFSPQPKIGSLPRFRNLEEAVRYLEEREKREKLEKELAQFFYDPRVPPEQKGLVLFLLLLGAKA
ncbi:MAG: hypothetical protein QXR87_07045 [Candidatus Hadarchaeales archaeon]